MRGKNFHTANPVRATTTAAASPATNNQTPRLPAAADAPAGFAFGFSGAAPVVGVDPGGGGGFAPVATNAGSGRLTDALATIEPRVAERDAWERSMLLPETDKVSALAKARTK